MHLEKLPEGILIALALVGVSHLLNLVWVAGTEFYMRRKIFNQPPPQGPQISPQAFAERELEERRRQIKFDYANAMIQLMRVTGYTPEVAYNAAKEVFKFAEEEAEKRHPYPDYWPKKDPFVEASKHM